MFPIFNPALIAAANRNTRRENTKRAIEADPEMLCPPCCAEIDCTESYPCHERAVMFGRACPDCGETTGDGC